MAEFVWPEPVSELLEDAFSRLTSGMLGDVAGALCKRRGAWANVAGLVGDDFRFGLGAFGALGVFGADFLSAVATFFATGLAAPDDAAFLEFEAAVRTLKFVLQAGQSSRFGTLLILKRASQTGHSRITDIDLGLVEIEQLKRNVRRSSFDAGLVCGGPHIIVDQSQK